MAGTTVGAVVFLILVGAVVRMTGSGMGCPDWPTCFGQWIPPTDISQLPPDYKIKFAVAGKEIADFDAFKTWVEYINRLLGVLIGLFSLGTLALSIPLRKTRPGVFGFSLAGFLAVLVVGGVGAYVVRSDLQEGVVTIHMVLALGALSLFILGLIESYRDRLLLPAEWKNQMNPLNRWLAWGSTALIAAQVVMGTQVREEIDRLAKSMGESTRDQWIDLLPTLYDVHSLFYYVLVAGLIFLGWRLKTLLSNWRPLSVIYISLWTVIAGAVLLGLGMHHLGIPAWMQPAHLLLATALFGLSLAFSQVLNLGTKPVQREALLEETW